MHELDRRPLKILSVVCLLLPSIAWAGPSAYRQSLTAQGLRNGFPRSSVAVLKRQEGPGREETAKRLLNWLGARFGGRLAPKQDDGRVLSYVSDEGYLEVHDDGTKFRFRTGAGDVHAGGGTREMPELSETDLEKLGLDFIRSLGSLVPQVAGESLTFMGTRVLKNGGTDLRGSWVQEVVAQIAIFGREVNGIPVIGKGSKIAVWFDRRRTPVGLYVDWPAYETTPVRQEILPLEDLRKRVEIAATPLAEAPDRTVSRFECGYVDLGSKKRGDYVQAGCAVFHDRGRAAGAPERSPQFEFVPAGIDVLEDPHWPLADFIAKGGVPGSGQSDPFHSETTGKNPGPGSPLDR